MTRSELEHLIRASGAIADDSELIVIGSQAILGQHPEAPAILLTGWCLEANDLAISKYVAGREKDLRFNAEMARAKLTTRDTLRARLAATELTDELRQIVAVRIDSDFGPDEKHD